jgi:hypothetical protein
MQEKLLAFKHMKGRHSGENLATEIMKVLDSLSVTVLIRYCIEKLIDVLGPLKEAPLMVSKSNDAMGIVNVLGIYHASTTLLEASYEKFDKDDQVAEGIEFAISRSTPFFTPTNM